MTRASKIPRRRIRLVYGVASALTGLFLLYESSSYGDMLFAPEKITFARHPLVAALVRLGESGGIWEPLAALGLYSILPVAIASLFVAVWNLWRLDGTAEE